jgi:hypothetical protein
MSKVFTEAEVAEVGVDSSRRLYRSVLILVFLLCPFLQHNNDKSCWLIIGNEKTGE